MREIPSAALPGFWKASSGNHKTGRSEKATIDNQQALKIILIYSACFVVRIEGFSLIFRH